MGYGVSSDIKKASKREIPFQMEKGRVRGERNSKSKSSAEHANGSQGNYENEKVLSDFQPKGTKEKECLRERSSGEKLVLPSIGGEQELKKEGEGTPFDRVGGAKETSGRWGVGGEGGRVAERIS